MATRTPGRTLLSLAVSAALIGLAAAPPAYAETLNYNGSQAEYDLLSGDTLMAGQRALMPATSYINNEVNITDTDNLSATNAYKSTVNVYGSYLYSSAGTSLTGNTVTVSGGTVNEVVGAYIMNAGGNISNNAVNLTGGGVATDIYGGYNSSPGGSATNNTVSLTGGTVGRNAYGGFAYAGSAGSGATNNTVSLTGGTVGNVYGGFAYAGSAGSNTVTISGGSVGGNVYGGYANAGSTGATNNTVTVSGGTVGRSVYGAYAGQSGLAVSGNRVTVSGDAAVAGSVAGGYRNLSSADVTDNAVSITGGTVGGSVAGGVSDSPYTSSVTGNTVSVSGGTVSSDVYGGYKASGTGTISGNAVTLTGGSVGNVYGGYRSSAGGAVTGNSVTLSGGTVTGGVYGGKVYTTDDAFTGNILNVANAKDETISVGSVQNFETVNMDLSNLSATTTALSASGDVTFGSAALDKKTTINITGVDSTSEVGRVFISSGGTMSGAFESTISGMKTVDYLTYIASVADNNLVLDYRLNWVDSNADKAHGTFTLTDADSAFTVGASLTDNEDITGTNSAGWDGKSLTKAGAGTLTLTGENTYTGGTTIEGGTLQIGNGGTAGSVAGDIVNNAALAFNRSDDVTYAGVVSGSGTLTKLGDNTLTLTGNSTYTGGTTIEGGTLQIGNGGTAGSVAGDIVNNAALAFNRSDDVTYAGVVSGSGTLTKLGDNTLTLTGNSTYAGGTTVSAGTLSLASVTGAGTGAIVNNARLALTGAQGTFSNAVSGSGDIAVEGGSSVTAAAAASADKVDIDDASRLTLADGVLWQAAGDFTNSGTLVLGNQSQLAGDVVNGGTLALSTEKNVTAYITGSLTNRGAVVLNPTPTSAGNTLEVSGDYVGEAGSSLSLGAVLAGDDSLTDKLSVLGNTSGSSTVYLTNENGSGAQTLEGIRVISVQGSSDATFTQGNRAVAGLYDYSLTKKGSNWYLTSYAEPTNPATPTNPVRQVRPEAAGYAANLQAANTLFALSLHDRVGETTYRDALTGEVRTTSLWVRNEGGRTATSMTDGQNKTHTNRYVLQVGGDVLTLSGAALGDLTLGVMGGYANAKGQTYNALKGYGARNTVSGYGTGLYGTWHQNGEAKGGLYADGWLQYNWFSNSVKGQDLAEERYDSRGLTASLEAGYDWQAAVWDTASGLRNTLWLRPHAQATWMGVRADDHVERNGTRVQGTGNDNVQTTLGVRAYLNGKSALDRDTGREFQPYVEANWVHNAGEYGVRMNEVGDSVKGTRDAAQLKAGVEAKASSRLSIWGGVSGMAGGEGYSDVGATLGGKFSF